MFNRRLTSSSILWWLDKAHAEVFTFSLLTIGVRACALVAVMASRSDGGAKVRLYFFPEGGATSLMMKTFSPGLMRPSSRRAISSMAAGSSRSRRASSRRRAFSARWRAIVAASSSYSWRAQHRQQSPIADQAVDHGHDRHEDQQKLHDAAAFCRPFGRMGAALRARAMLQGGHAPTTVQQSGKKYKAQPRYC